MQPDVTGTTDHNSSTAHVQQTNHPPQRRPGELGFAIFLTLASVFLLYNAYGISGFRALSGAGSVPMATTMVMTITALIVTLRTARLGKVAGETLAKDILPVMVIAFIGLLIVFGLLLKPLGFVLTAALFLICAIKLLSRKGWVYTISIAFLSLVIIWVVFRVVFTVLLPAGILPEAEFIQFFRNLFAGGAS